MARKTQYLIFLAVLFLFFMGCDKILAPKPVPDTGDLANYTLVWEDDFNQDSKTLNPDNWNYELGYGGDGWGNDEWQQYTNSLDNIKVEDGNLVITAVWDSVSYPVPGKRDGSITSARINSKNKFSVKFGKIQARIKVPTDDGMWPAFWMLGTNYDSQGWPQCGEIDIMEVSPLLHGNDTAMSTVHWWDDDSASHVYEGSTKKLSEPLSNDYHIYEVEWDESRIVGKIDGMSYFVKVIDPSTMDEFFKKFFLIFNVAVGGSLGGSPTANTNWPQSMYVDWVRVYQKDSSLIPIQTYGIFTDETPVDAALQIGVNAEVYVWENTLSTALLPPYEGANVLSWSTTGQGWFGAGVSSNSPLDLSTFEEGNINFWIKIPANVTFKIGINDAMSNQSYVTFPANQTAFGLTRNGEWGKATIPVSAIKGNVDLEIVSYEFIILEEQGSQCEFAIDDIYWDGGGLTAGSVSFNNSTYSADATSATISVSDLGASSSSVNVSVSNGTQSISVSVALDASGQGSANLNFGSTNDASDTISITAGGSLTATYIDSNGSTRLATASIEGGSSADTIGIYSETHTSPMLTYSQIINSADWSGNSAAPDEQSTAVSPVDGSYVLSIDFTDIGAGWGGIAFNFGSQDISEYNILVLNLNKTAMQSLAHYEIKFEDNSGGQTPVDLFSYTPVVTGDWHKFEIPLSHFAAVNMSQVKYLGLWNPKNSTNALLVGTLYLDDIYLKK
jgi:beta-glucanase (GH16 family)